MRFSVSKAVLQASGSKEEKMDIGLLWVKVMNSFRQSDTKLYMISTMQYAVRRWVRSYDTVFNFGM
jgi:hypothetical protein